MTSTHVQLTEMAYVIVMLFYFVSPTLIELTCSHPKMIPWYGNPWGSVPTIVLCMILVCCPLNMPIWAFSLIWRTPC